MPAYAPGQASPRAGKAVPPLLPPPSLYVPTMPVARFRARFPGLSGLSGRVFRRSGKKSAKKFEENAEAGLQSPEDVLS